jgi:hypothetical protein
MDVNWHDKIYTYKKSKNPCGDGWKLEYMPKDDPNGLNQRWSTKYKLGDKNTIGGGGIFGFTTTIISSYWITVPTDLLPKIGSCDEESVLAEWSITIENSKNHTFEFQVGGSVKKVDIMGGYSYTTSSTIAHTNTIQASVSGSKYPGKMLKIVPLLLVAEVNQYEDILKPGGNQQVFTNANELSRLYVATGYALCSKECKCES